METFRSVAFLRHTIMMCAEPHVPAVVIPLRVLGVTYWTEQSLSQGPDSCSASQEIHCPLRNPVFRCCLQRSPLGWLQFKQYFVPVYF
jgi:hypothetical protein